MMDKQHKIFEQYHKFDFEDSLCIEGFRNQNTLGDNIKYTLNH